VALNALLRAETPLSVDSVALKRHQPWQKKIEIPVLRDARISDPGWLLQPPRDGHYEVDDLDGRVRPEPPPSLFHDFTVLIGDRSFRLRRPVLKHSACQQQEVMASISTLPFSLIPSN